METTQRPIERGMDKETVVHQLQGILLAIQNSEISLFVTKWSQLDSMMLSSGEN